MTCQSQPALGCVYKLVELNGEPRIKLSQDIEKVTIPGRKDAFRLMREDGIALVDILQPCTEDAPQAGVRVLVRHPFVESKRAHVVPHTVKRLYECVWDQGKVALPLATIHELRERVQKQLASTRLDHRRAVNPTPYKVSIAVGSFKGES